MSRTTLARTLTQFVAVAALLSWTATGAWAGTYYAFWDGHQAAIDLGDSAISVTNTSTDDLFTVTQLLFQGESVTGDSVTSASGSTDGFVDLPGGWTYNYALAPVSPIANDGQPVSFSYAGSIDLQGGHPFAVRFGDDVVVVDAEPIPEPALWQMAGLLALGASGMTVARRRT